VTDRKYAVARRHRWKPCPVADILVQRLEAEVRIDEGLASPICGIRCRIMRAPHLFGFVGDG